LKRAAPLAACGSLLFVVQARRPVNWSLIVEGDLPEPVLVPKSAQGEIGSLLAAFSALPALEGEDALVKRAIEVARFRIGLDRVAVFLRDQANARMLGTWGTGLAGELVDERHIMFDVSDAVGDVFDRAETLSEPFTVLDNCPIVVHGLDSSQVVGRGWVACTPIRSARSRIGIMFNDAGLAGTAVDEARQERAAILCSLLGSVLELSRARSAGAKQSREKPVAAAVRKALELLDQNPTLGGKELASAVDVSLSRFVRLFKSELGVSLVEYRNRLRIERFHVLAGAGADNLQAVARAAGFGSYAQFHRVFRAVHGSAPKAYLRAR
jgi:AraC-like DNA-binding protein